MNAIVSILQIRTTAGSKKMQKNLIQKYFLPLGNFSIPFVISGYNDVLCGDRVAFNTPVLFAIEIVKTPPSTKLTVGVRPRLIQSVFENLSAPEDHGRRRIFRLHSASDKDAKSSN